MKQLIFIMSLIAFISCKDNKKQEKLIQNKNVEKHTKATLEHHQENAATVYNNLWTVDIQLNNGQKWNANSETNEGVQKMQNSIKTHTTITLEDYHKLAEQLNDDKNYVIKNCTMKGPSHDNLHIWLLPLIEKIDALSETKILEDTSKIKHMIVENINSYNTYFK